MIRLAILLSISLCFWMAWAQTPQGQITISTQPPVGQFYVDGKLYTGAASFIWPEGSKHILQFKTDPPLPGQSASTVQTTVDGNTKYTFGGWKDNAGLLQVSGDPVQTITANPNLTSITTQLAVAYKITLNYFKSSDVNVPASCGSPGTIPPGVFRPGVVVINGSCYWTSTVFFAPAGVMTLNAIPYPGFVFLGWALNLGPADFYLRTTNVTGPMQISPEFSPGKRVSFYTNPLGLQVLVDRTPTPTRTLPATTGVCPSNETLPPPPPAGISPLCFGDFDFAPGSTHLIGGVSPQKDRLGKVWVFSSWSNGGAQNTIYKVDSNLATADVLTANFVPGASISILTNPPGLKLNVDGRQNWPSYNFIWGLGETHTVSPVMEQFDSKGRKYVYKSWSNSAPASQSITVDQSAVNSGLRVIANYQILNRLVVQSNPSGLTLTVDGSSCLTPCFVDRPSGAQVPVSAPVSSGRGDNARMDFNGWSDGANADHLVTLSADTTTLTANYTSSYLLSTGSNPPNGVTFKFAPRSADGFYPANSRVTVTATANPGYQFLKWEGDLSGTYPIGTLSMGTPHTVMAIVGRVPYLGPAAVKNAAGDTPSETIAPGSIFSIFGQSLAPQVQVGPVNPLAQSLSGVSVTVGDRILPLLFVSPEQINAQLPSDLPPGKYTLLVQANGQPDVNGTFTVARNSPGLFTNVINEKAYAVALHENGSVITPDSPAKQGEQISVLGTGFGPYRKPVPDGFMPLNPPPALTDSVTILAGEARPETDWSGAAVGYTGVAVVKFKITPDLPSASSVELKVQINGQTSNTVLLPVQ